MTARPRTTIAATQLLERYADLTLRIDLVEADRSDAIATANQRADTAAMPMLEEMAAMRAALEPWWAKNRDTLVVGKKSAELGGCMIGTRQSKAKLTHSLESESKAVEALLASRYAKHTTRVSYSLDRSSTLKLLQIGGKTAASIAKLGFSIEPGTDKFFIERVQQDCTIGS